MKATEAKLLEFLKKSPQFVIPIYQRTYSWDESQCQQLWNDMLATGANEKVSAHFIGSVVYIEKGLYQISTQPPLLVIDGQQRLTTVSLILEALARHIVDAEVIDGFSAKKLRSYYLLNPLEEGERGYKLLLTQSDKETLLSIVRQKPYPTNLSRRVKENFEFFQRSIGALGPKLPDLCKGLAKLMIVDVALTRGQDNPQLIFESMNSTGKELSQADLIRNFVLMGLEPEHQTQLYEECWRPMEIEFGQDAYGAHFDSFMRHFLTLKTGDIPNVRAVYEAFKKFSLSEEALLMGIDGLVSDIREHARYYCSMALAKEVDPKLSDAFHDLRDFKVDVAYPFLLRLYGDYVSGFLTRDDFASALRLTESYVFRRAICAIPTNSLNKTFAALARKPRAENYLEGVQAELLLQPSYRRFPDDDEFAEGLKTRDLYHFPRRTYWLRRIENHGRKERVPVDEYTIEHILPQAERLDAEWMTDLGPDWKRVQQVWLHTMGNLTLTGYNSEYGARPFAEKRDMKGGFRDSPLKLNEGLGQLSVWNVAEIKARASRLSSIAIGVWAVPSLSAAVLEKYRPKREQPLAYSISDHPNLADGTTTRNLFESFRKEVLALDACVIEEFLKLYVAYKAETNFVDIVPQSNRLRLSLNMRFVEINDPRKMCRDVTNLGRWGNGDVEVVLSTIDDLPYVLGLVRQAFEKQMDSAELVA
jgi:uncharacterized protein with ParB-like and HNH nuclease domain/predicted transport protein